MNNKLLDMMALLPSSEKKKSFMNIQIINPQTLQTLTYPGKTVLHMHLAHEHDNYAYYMLNTNSGLKEYCCHSPFHT